MMKAHQVQEMESFAPQGPLTRKRAIEALAGDTGLDLQDVRNYLHREGPLGVDPDACSNTIRTARSRTSGEYLVLLSIAPPSHEREPPEKSGRFRPRLRAVETQAGGGLGGSMI